MGAIIQRWRCYILHCHLYRNGGPLAGVSHDIEVNESFNIIDYSNISIKTLDDEYDTVAINKYIQEK